MTIPMPMLRSSSSNKPQHDELVKEQIRSCKNVDLFMYSSSNLEGVEQDLALFHRHEIQVGALVGSGSFSEVYEIASFDCSGKDNNNKKSKRRTSKTCSIAPADTTAITTTTTTALDSLRRRKRNQLITEQQDNTRDQGCGKKLQSRYVIKQLHAKLVSDPKLFRRAVKDMATEARIMSRLTHHPHIASLRATAIGGTGALADGHHDSYFLVLDRLVETLDDRITQWNQDKIKIGPSYYLDSATHDAKMDLKANYAWQIASALNFLHENHIIFRDLKPQNIGFKEVHPDHPERDVLALFDFGLSRTLPDAEEANDEGMFRMSMVGTRRYMAPEIVTSRIYNQKVDTYSWGLVFYELVSQQRPYDGMQRGEHKQFICVQGKRPKLYSYYGLPAELEHILRLAWAQEVSQRVTMSEVCHVLETYLKGTVHEHAVRSVAALDVDALEDASESSGHTEPTTASSHAFSFDSSSSHNHPRLVGVSPTTTTTIVSTDAMVPSSASHDVSEARADVAEAVPQAIAVVDHGDDPHTHETLPPHDLPPLQRRSSLCERFTNMFRSGVRMFC